jgi:xanthine dehydrogenase accessory factor
VTGAEVLIAAGKLAAEGAPFALATVVDVRPPASARRGDRGLVGADGRLSGWVGGACSEPVVVRESLLALADGQPRLVRIGPPGRAAQGAPPGAVIAESSCASEGVVTVLVEPQLPAPVLAVVGTGPAAETLARLAPEVGWRVVRDASAGAEAVVVASMGHGDEEAIAAALTLGTGYVALVASARRAGVVREALRRRGVSEAEVARLRSPAGLDLGPLTQPEIAVAVLAELIAWRHARTPAPAAATAVDPICGMEVALEGARHTSEHDGRTYVFCCEGCRDRFEAHPERYAAAVE